MGNFLIAKFMTKNLNLGKNWLELLVLLVLVFEFGFPHISLAQAISESNSLNSENSLAADLADESGKIQLVKPTKTAQSVGYKVVKTYQIPVTAYSSTVDQCDSTPCITANGFDLCENNQENVIAANFLPFGTKVRMPEYFGDRIFTVQDRMNSRYYLRADVWFKTREAARIFGIRNLTLEVVE